MVGTPFTWKGEFVIKKPWSDVMRAAQVKYPNPFNPSVLSIDVVSRSVDRETGVLHTVKLINSSWPMFTNAGELRAIERTEIDPVNQKMLLESNNIDMRSVLKAHERLEYEVHPDNAEWTLIRHQISVDAFRFIAYAALSASQKAASSGREALNWVIENRVDNFMNQVPERVVGVPAIAESQSSASVTRPQLRSPSSIWSRLRSFSLPSHYPLVRTVRANVTPTSSSLTSKSSWLEQGTSSLSSIPSALNRAITSFDSFHPVDALGEIKERVSTDVSALTDQLRRRCQRVIDRFTKIDEYVLIM